MSPTKFRFPVPVFIGTFVFELALCVQVRDVGRERVDSCRCMWHA